MLATDSVPSREILDLQHEMAGHRLWSSRLLNAASRGLLTLDDFRYVFSQYYAYSRDFTRYLASVMASCPDDYLRSRLSENIWEEGGGLAAEERHAQIFRTFLVDALGLDPAQITFDDDTRAFTEAYLRGTRSEDHAYAAAFLSLGTEAIVSRLYQVFVDGMRPLGLSDASLRFFHLHIGCDDEHAATLMMILEHSRHSEGWIDRVRRGMNDALDARWAFFEALHDRLEERRYKPMIDRIRGRESLVPPSVRTADFVSRFTERPPPMYTNDNPRLKIQFVVERVRAPGAQALDPRWVRIPSGFNNERHRHAHETLFYIVAGEGNVMVGDKVIPVGAGDTVFIPRWEFHQSQNTGVSELVILAVTDFGLTSAVLGDYDRSTRLEFRGRDAVSQPPPPPEGRPSASPVALVRSEPPPPLRRRAVPS